MIIAMSSMVEYPKFPWNKILYIRNIPAGRDRETHHIKKLNLGFI